MDKLAGNKILAGSRSGRQTFGELMKSLGDEPKEPVLIFLDFADVEVATASFLRESIIVFRDAVRGRRSNYYPIIANANEHIREELRVLLKPHRDVLMLCTLDNDCSPSNPELVGELELKQRITFDLVNKLGETQASELANDFKQTEYVLPTAWNNRLVSLSKLGLVVEHSHGRSKRYKPVLVGEK